jgi:Holliday junction resolvase RusA-like endonuclease
LYKKCRVNVLSKTYRLADEDGRSIKAVVDGLRKAGIFKDDNSKIVTNVSHTQEKIASGENEETIIEITEV